jgi:hypothetical protein
MSMSSASCVRTAEARPVGNFERIASVVAGSPSALVAGWAFVAGSSAVGSSDKSPPPLPIPALAALFGSRVLDFKLRVLSRPAGPAFADSISRLASSPLASTSFFIVTWASRPTAFHGLGLVHVPIAHVVGWVQPTIGSGPTAGGLHPPYNLRTVESITLAPFPLKHADFCLRSRSLSASPGFRVRVEHRQKWLVWEHSPRPAE